jgi:hypothetical protein
VLGGGIERELSLCAVLIHCYNRKMANCLLCGVKGRKLSLSAVSIDRYDDS